MTAVDDALDLAARGWRVIPIAPKDSVPGASGKYPAGFGAWQEKATTDPATIRQWYEEHPDYGVGIATGRESNLFVVDVDVSHGKVGDESLKAVEAEHGSLPEGAEVVTGSGGRHLYFTFDGVPDSAAIRNDAGRKLGPDLDIRGDGGFVVAPPTIHPETGQRYEWEIMAPDAAATPPAWLVEKVTAEETPEQVVRALKAVAGDQTASPGDRYAATHTWAETLAPEGWTFAGDHRGELFWTRPGKDAKAGSSATTGYTEADNLCVFTTSIPWLPPGHYTKLGYVAAARFGGDLRAAALAVAPPIDLGKLYEDTFSDELRSETVPARRPEPEHGSWHAIDLTAADIEPSPPTELPRSDGQRLLYSAALHWLSGEPEAGKTWLALVAVAVALAEGRHVTYLDYEDSASGFIERLRAIGVDPMEHAAARRLSYLNPAAAITGPALERLLGEYRADLVVIDACTAAMAVEGLDPNSNTDVARWLERIPKPLARNGSSVLVLDHVTKSKEGRDRWAIGGQHKLAAVDGAAYTLESLRPVGRAHHEPVEGLSRLVLVKDRRGHLRRLGGPQRLAAVADVSMTAYPDDYMRIDLDAPGQGSASTNAQAEVVGHLAVYDGASTRAIRDAVGGTATAVDAAVKELVASHHVTIAKVGNAHQHTLTHMGREAWKEIIDEATGDDP